MTQDEIIAMTRQAANAIPGYTAKVEDPSGAVLEFYNRFAELVAQHEREWVGLSDEDKQDWIKCMPWPPEPAHLMVLIEGVESELKDLNR